MSSTKILQSNQVGSAVAWIARNNYIKEIINNERRGVKEKNRQRQLQQSFY
jgi:hypothetical protein